ncbi:MAG: ABC transporter permease [Deltaproteobacteria bacterium]|nr:ABC transporter permease [Deltaproteobacteria bacterium]MBW1931056.1 ABC transporter permease [Deltaproteobacteria bacterium]MBW2025125.1 ABC transporter permease [Deltaproteobacteria bacterium]MBW2125081.1 ABC transporter permease [Deltaproteobacteria bacterium]
MKVGKLTKKDLINNYGALLAFITVIIVFSFISRGFFSGMNLENILVQSTSLGICAFGLTLVLMMGEIDLSYGGLIGLVGAVLAGMVKDGHSITFATFVCLAIALGSGLLTAILVVGLKLPSFLASVAVMFICMGAERVYNQGITTWIRDTSALSIVQAHIGPVPLPIFYLFLLFVVCSLIQTQTRMGQYIRAVGENADAVREAGIKVGLVKFLVFVAAGILFGFGGYIETLRIGAAVMYAGKQLLLFVLAACFLGTATFKAGKANFPGTLIGAFFLYTLMSGFTGLGLKFYLVPIAQGFILILAVAISSVRRGKIEQVQF